MSSGSDTDDSGAICIYWYVLSYDNFNDDLSFKLYRTASLGSRFR